MKGIYQIFNTKNGKSYIGQSKDISHRKNCHIYDLKNNRHKNKALQNDYNEDPKSIIFRILCKCEEEYLDDLERYFIKKYDSIENGYNILIGGKSGFFLPENTRKKISDKHTGNKYMVGIKLSDEWKKHLSEAQPHRKKVRCIDTGIIYDSFADAARKTGLHRTKIVSCCTGKRKSTGGFHFEYADT